MKNLFGETVSQFPRSSYRRKFTYKCVQCGDNFQSENIGIKFCSKRCWGNHRNKKPDQISCEHCGELFKPALKAARFCSNKCSAHFKLSLQLPKKLCTVCGQSFQPKTLTQKNCSDKCTKQFNVDKRLFRMATAHSVEVVSPVKVIKRDNCKCYICGTETPLDLRGTQANNAPEIDHVIPTGSEGFSHTYENCRCICRKCNNAKSDRTEPIEPEVSPEERERRIAQYKSWLREGFKS